MLVGILSALFIIMCLFMVLLILIQQGKGSMGIGAIGGGSQMLFGGSGGQDLFQKMTWFLGAVFIFGSLGLSIFTAKEHTKSRYASHVQQPAHPVMPVDTTAQEEA